MAMPTYLGRGDPALANYYPAWLDNMASDATVEGSLLDGAVLQPSAARASSSRARNSTHSSRGIPSIGSRRITLGLFSV
jgi:hypothetical protein